MDKLKSGLSDIVDDEEDLARFLMQSNLYSASIVKPSAFLPNKKDRETSVFRHGSDPQATLWAMGEVAANGRNLYGAAIVKAGIVRKARLEVLADEPPERHAAIRNWPWIDDDPDLQKAQQKEIALVIASKSELLLH